MSKPKQETNETELSAADLSQVQGGLSIYIPPGSTKPFRPNIQWPLPLPRPPILIDRIRDAIEKARQKHSD